MAGLSGPIATGTCFSKKKIAFSTTQLWIPESMLLFLGKQMQKQLGYSSPAFCFSPDEKSGAAAAVGFSIERCT
jgi:hypothetical protein